LSFPRNVFFKLASFQESCYHLFIRPDGRALLESNPSAAAGDDGVAGLCALPLFFLPIQIPLKRKTPGVWGRRSRPSPDRDKHLCSSQVLDSYPNHYGRDLARGLRQESAPRGGRISAAWVEETGMIRSITWE